MFRNWFMPKFVLIFVLTACGVEDGTWTLTDSSQPDASIGQPDLGCTANCTPKLRVGTWNLQNFPKAGNTVSAAASAIAALDIDVLGIQEIQEPAAFLELVTKLHGYEGVLAEPGWYSGVGLIYRSSTVKPTDVESLFVDESRFDAFPRPPLRFSAEVHGSPMTFIVVHLKAKNDADSKQRRRDACQKIDGWIEQHPGEEVIVLGDWNDEIDDPLADNVFTSLLDDPNDYRFLTDTLAADNAYSYVPYRRLLDHILVTDEVLEGRETVNTDILRFDLSISGYASELSDHLPVIGSFSLR